MTDGSSVPLGQVLGGYLIGYLTILLPLLFILL